MLKLVLHTIDGKQVGKPLISEEDMLFSVLEAVKEGFPVRQEDDYFVWHNPAHVYTAKIEQLKEQKDGKLGQGDLEHHGDRAKPAKSEEAGESTTTAT